MTSDGKYWIVEIYTSVYHNEFSIVTVDAKTWKSKIDNGEWRSLDELKPSYIAEFQSEGSLREPQKTTINNKEIWKILVHTNIPKKMVGLEKMNMFMLILQQGKVKTHGTSLIMLQGQMVG